MKLDIKNNVQIAKMRAAGKLAAQVLDMLTPHVQAGVSTEKLNQLAHDFIIKNGATPAPLNYHGFPKSICTSLNSVVCHGIPSETDILKDGDIINIDTTVILDGFHGDTSRMYTVGNVTPEAQALCDITHFALMESIKTVKSGSWLSEIAKTIQTIADEKGYGVVQDYVGHGLGEKFHEMPQVPHHYPSGLPDIRLRKGMTFTIEPMINIGGWECDPAEADGWTVHTADRSLSAQWEHTLLVTADGVEILTESCL